MTDQETASVNTNEHEPHKSEQQARSRPPEEQLSELPELEEGDEVTIKSLSRNEPDRTLTVTKTNPDEADLVGLEPRVMWPFHENESVLLKGYGTLYHLTVVGGNVSPRNVVLVWPSNQHPAMVGDVEVLEQ